MLHNKLINTGLNQSRILHLVKFNNDTFKCNETFLCKKNRNQILGENLGNHPMSWRDSCAVLPQHSILAGGTRKTTLPLISNF